MGLRFHAAMISLFPCYDDGYVHLMDLLSFVEDCWLGYFDVLNVWACNRTKLFSVFPGTSIILAYCSTVLHHSSNCSIWNPVKFSQLSCAKLSVNVFAAFSTP